MAHEALDPAFRQLIDEYAPVRQLGVRLRVHRRTDLASASNSICCSPTCPATCAGAGTAERRARGRCGRRNKGNGMTYDADLNLIVCEHATSSRGPRSGPTARARCLPRISKGASSTARTTSCVKSDGAIYFTDPWYGRMPVFGVERPRQLGFQGVYRVTPGRREPELLVDRYLFGQPNGLCFSPDERLLYINDTEKALIRVFDVDARRIARRTAASSPKASATA